MTIRSCAEPADGLAETGVLPGRCIDDVLINETSDREVVSVETNTGGGVGTGRMSWRELKP